jgi:hypothetical protein
VGAGELGVLFVPCRRTKEALTQAFKGSRKVLENTYEGRN